MYSALREALRAVKRADPFTIDAFVLLPDHLHCLWTLPEGDADYALRWNLVKRRVSQQVRRLITTDLTSSRRERRNWGYGNAASGNTRYATTLTLLNTSITSIGTGLNMVTLSEWPTGRIRAFIVM